MSSAATPAISSFDAENPAGFYLLEKQARLEPLADAVLVVQGVELPAHSQVKQFSSTDTHAGLLCSAGAPPRIQHLAWFAGWHATHMAAAAATAAGGAAAAAASAAAARLPAVPA